MKRRSCASTRTTRRISQQSSADPSVTFFKLEHHDALPDSDPESGRRLLAFPARRSKRVKVHIINTEGTASCGGDDEKLPGLATKAPTGKERGKGKAARPPLARTPSSESAALPKKPKAIKQALEKP